MPVVAAIVGSAIIGGGASLLAAHQAKKGATQAADTASQTQLQMYQQTRTDLQPFMQGGASAFSQLASIFGFGPGGTGMPNAQAAMSQLTQFPGYQFGLDQGVQALDRSAASRGMALSGAQLQDAQKFGQGYAMQQAWQPYVSGLQWASNLGENAAAGVGQAGATAANGAAQAQLQGGLAAGQAGANGVAGVANSLQSGLQQYMLQQGQGGGYYQTDLPQTSGLPAVAQSGDVWGLY